jgi:hypothetical protein
MERLRFGARFLLLVMVVLAGLATPAGFRVHAQAGSSTFVSPMTGIQIQTSAPWSVDPSMVIQEEGVESITVMSDFAFMQVWFMPGSVDLVEARDVVMESFIQEFGTFVEIDRGAYGNVSYSLDLTSVDGMEFGVFSLFLGQRESGYVEYYVFMGPPSLFAQTFASAQQSVVVNGTDVFGGVDGAGLQTLLLANAGATGASTTTTTTEAPPVPQLEPTPPPTQQAQPTTAVPASNDGAIYLESLQGEIAYLQGTIDDFIVNLGLLGTDAQSGVAGLTQVAEEWAAYRQRAASITVPPGFESLDAQYRDVVDTTDVLVSLWNDLLDSARAQDGQEGDRLTDLALGVDAFQLQIDELATAVATAGSGSSQTTPPQPPADVPPQPTQVPAEPESQTSGTLSAEQSAYLQDVRSELDSMETSVFDFLALFGQISADGDNQQIIDDILAIMDEWTAYPQTAAAIVAPPGMEDVGGSFQVIAAAFPSAADTFQGAMAAGAEGNQAGLDAGLEDLSSQLGAILTDITMLRDTIAGYESAGSSTTQPGQAEVTQPPVETPAPQPAETPTPQPAETPTDLTETGNRGQLPQLPGMPGQQDDPVSPSTDYEDLGLVSDSEYISPQFGIDVTWDDRWAFDESAFDIVIASDEENAEDWITLVWTGGNSGDITITLAAFEDLEPGDFVAYWESDEYIDQFNVAGEVLLADTSRDRGGVLLLLGEDGDQIVLYREVVCLSRACDQVALVTIFSPVIDAPDLIADAEEGIEIDGEAATGMFSTRQVDRALGQ